LRETRLRLIAFFPCLQTSDAAREGGDVHAKHKPSTLTCVTPLMRTFRAHSRARAHAPRDLRAGFSSFLMISLHAPAGAALGCTGQSLPGGQMRQ